MAKKEFKGTSFIRCDAFWQPEPGESFTGILLDCNEKAVDKLSGNLRPLYIFAALCPKGEKATFMLEKQAVKIKPGQIVGVNSCGELAQKMGANVAQFFGHETTLTFVKKETFERDGKTLPIKRYKVEADDAVPTGSHVYDGETKPYASYARPDAKPIASGSAKDTDEEIPFEAPSPN